MTPDHILDSKTEAVLELKKAIQYWDNHNHSASTEHRNETGLLSDQLRQIFTCEPMGITEECISLVCDATYDFPGERIRESDLIAPKVILFFPPDSFFLQNNLDGDGVNPGPDDRVVEWLAWSVKGQSLQVSMKAHDSKSAIGEGWDLAFGDFCEQGADIFIQVLNKVAMETIVSRRRQQASRYARKRAAKKNVPVTDVTVLTLKRLKRKETESEEERAWSHRWIVRGHWRNHFYPSTQTHRLKFISSYIKGPEDKPLVMKKRVINFTRSGV